MVDQWEWDTFVILNKERESINIAPLTWCCALENTIRGSCGGIIFDINPPIFNLVSIDCPHFTPPDGIAKLILSASQSNQNEEFNISKDILEPSLNSGVLIITNDYKKSHVYFACSKQKAITWDEIQKYRPHKHQIEVYDSRSGYYCCRLCGMIAPYDAFIGKKEQYGGHG